MGAAGVPVTLECTKLFGQQRGLPVSLTCHHGSNGTGKGTSFVRFFFSSRRQHTRLTCDWSSAVCSSDLLAIERGQKQDLLLRASPLPPSIYLLAKVVNAALFALVALIVLFVFAHFTASVNLAAGTWVTLAARLLLGSIPFIGLGLGFGYLVGPNAAPAVINFVYLPTAFASGIFIPVSQLPDFIKGLAPYLPLNPFVELGWNAIGVNTDRAVSTDVLYLVAYAVGFFALAMWAYRRDTAAKFA